MQKLEELVEPNASPEALLKHLDTDDLDQLNQAVEAFIKLGEDAVPALLSALNQNEETRKNAAWILGMIRSESSVKALYTLMLTDSAVSVQLAAAWALRNFQLPVLRQFIFQKIPKPQNFDELAEYFESKSWKARWYCTVFMQKRKTPELLNLLLKRAQNDENVLVRCSAILSLMGYQGEKVDETLILLVSDLNDFVKIEAATLLSLKRIRKAVPALLKQLGARNPEVRSAILLAIGSLGNAKVIPYLIKELQNEKEPLVRTSAAMGLYEVLQSTSEYSPKLGPALIALLGDSNPYVIRNIVRCLGLVNTEETFQALLKILKRAPQDIDSVSLIQALGHIQDKRAVPLLLKSFKSPHWEVRFDVVRVLGLFKERRCYNALLIALKDSSLRVKEQAVFALGNQGNLKAIPVLEKLKLKHPYGEINQSINLALDRLLEL